MAERESITAWQFNLRRLFFAVTTSAIGCGLAASDLPLDLKYFGLCAPLFWAGMAIMFVGATVIKFRPIAVQILAEFLMALGFALAFLMVLVASIAFLLQIILLIVDLNR